MSLVVRDVCFTPAADHQIETGLLGFVRVVINARLVLDGITVRRTREGRLTLSFPSRRGRSGEQHAYIRPLDDDARRDIERQVLDAIGLGNGGAQ